MTGHLRDFLPTRTALAPEAVVAVLVQVPVAQVVLEAVDRVHTLVVQQATEQ